MTKISYIHREGPGSLGSGDDVIFQYVEVTDDDVRVRYLCVNPDLEIEVGSDVSAGEVIGATRSLKSRYLNMKDYVHVEAAVKNEGSWVNIGPMDWLGL